MTLDAAKPLSILDSLSISIATVDLDGTILFVNEAAAQSFAATRESLLGASLYALYPAVAPATRERIRQTASRREVQHFESVVPQADGTVARSDSAYHPSFDEEGNVVAVHITATNIARWRPSPSTDEATDGIWRVVADDMSMTPDRLSAVLKTLPLVIAIHDSDMAIRYMNWVVEGFDIDDVIGSSPLQWLSEEGKRATETAFATVLESHQTVRYEAESLDGRRWLCQLVPLLHAGRVKQILSCGIDITELRRLEAELLHRQKVDSLGTMAGGIAHDFNNLLTVITGNLVLAQRWMASDRDPSSLLSNIGDAARKAADLCNLMLAYAGRDRAAQEPGSLNQVVEEMAGLTRAAIHPKFQTSYELARDLPSICCSKGQIGQVVLNLINNAADAIGDDCGCITVTTDTTTLAEGAPGCLPEPLPPGHYVRLRVVDTGRGIDPETLPRIFDPFYTTRSTGHGLGLSAVLGIVTSHRAAIEVNSTVGQGTAVSVYFPIDERLDAGARDESSEASWVEGRGTVLVVDDDDLVRQAAACVLSEAGYEVHEARDGDEALTLVSALRQVVVGVVLDVTMPRRDGYSTLEELRKTHPELPVLLSSGRPMDLPEKSRVDPFLSLLPKPYRPDALLKAVAESIRAGKHDE